MNYALILITHGEAPQLDAVVDAFAAHVRPRPALRVAVVDGPGRLPPAETLGFWTILGHERQQGFGAAVASGWKLAVASGCEYVFWLNDFVIDHDVRLDDLAFLLDRDPRIAQVGLMRDAYSLDEHRAGGLYELRRDDYQQHEEGPLRWLEQSVYFTTNPSLMRREFMAENPWPADGRPYPEGRYGIDLVARGYRFAVMGHGEVWTRHVGVRTGIGY